MAAKAAEVSLLEVRLGMGIGGKSFVLLSGEVAAVREAISAGVSREDVMGMLVAQVVIPNPSVELFQSLI